MVRDSKVFPRGGRPGHLIYGFYFAQSLTATTTSTPPLPREMKEVYKWLPSAIEISLYQEGIDASKQVATREAINTCQSNETLVNAIKVAASTAGLCQVANRIGKYPKSSAPSWIDRNCRTMNKTIRGLHKEFVKDRQNQIKLQAYLSAKRELTEMMRFKEHKYKQTITDCLSSAKNPLEFWSTYRRLNPRVPKKCPIDIEKWESFYESNYSAHNPLPVSINHEVFNPSIDYMITTDECTKCVAKLRNNKAPGPDVLSNEFFKNLPDSGIDFLTNLFNEVLSSGNIPAS